MTDTIMRLLSVALESAVRQGETFTAHEITQRVRQQTNENVKHEEVRAFVHDQAWSLIEGQFGYERTLAKLPNVSPQPWVYHKPGADLSAYGYPKPQQLTVVQKLLSYFKKP